MSTILLYFGWPVIHFILLISGAFNGKPVWCLVKRLAVWGFVFVGFSHFLITEYEYDFWFAVAISYLLTTPSMFHFIILFKWLH